MIKITDQHDSGIEFITKFILSFFGYTISDKGEIFKINNKPTKLLTKNVKLPSYFKPSSQRECDPGLSMIKFKLLSTKEQKISKLKATIEEYSTGLNYKRYNPHPCSWSKESKIIDGTISFASLGYNFFCCSNCKRTGFQLKTGGPIICIDDTTCVIKHKPLGYVHHTDEKLAKLFNNAGTNHKVWTAREDALTFLFNFRGELHSLDGPAITSSFLYKEYWINGKQLTEKSFNKERYLIDNTI